ncbi:GNAT family N-acetyltransferase [Acidihalobacter yilgarnensis]|uniref:GNAT family N-acetyltransferase n=1 Tax=Acidihalobacter yilgarnensis TaxID=2819280 RepID=A0A1D8IKD1_9GAMM|nr:GNAT family N-acetyltransferase [Acidihalobacter yilgarnensis]AOU96894.1 GNAT family N-acetyltransferase [Acidihalobacter yilgarnensis]
MNVDPHIREAQSDEDIRRGFAVMSQLRPHLATEDFTTRVRRLMAGGFRLALLEDVGKVRAVAGFRLTENLSVGRFLYVDDLVTDEAVRSHGHGSRLLAWLEETARDAGCAQLVLDSGVQRFDAHRFYLRAGYAIRSHHLSRML